MTDTIATPATSNDLTSLTGTYAVDASHSTFGFVARHAMITKVRGTFADFEGTLVVDGANITASTANIVIKAESLSTRNEQRDGHLRANDFFDMDTYPTLSYVSTSIEHVRGDDYRITGDLTIKGTTKPVTFDVEFTGSATDPFGNARVGLSGTTTVNRKDWGLNWNAPLEAGGVLVGDKVVLELDISAVKQS